MPEAARPSRGPGRRADALPGLRTDDAGLADSYTVPSVIGLQFLWSELEAAVHRARVMAYAYPVAAFDMEVKARLQAVRADTRLFNSIE